MAMTVLCGRLLPAVAAEAGANLVPQRSGIDLALMDPAVSPRVDLFRHANGRWLATTPIPADRAGYGIDAIVQDRTELQLRELVEQLARRQDLAPDSSGAKIAGLYSDFMDASRCDQLGTRPLKPLFDHIDTVHDRDGLATLFGELSLLGIDLPLEIGVSQDERDTTRYLVHVAQGGLSMPDRDYYLDHKDARFRRMRADFVHYAEAQFRRIHEVEPGRAARDVLVFETRLAKAQWDRVANRDPLKTYNPRTLAELRTATPHLRWDRWLATLGLPADPGTVIVAQPSYQLALDRILQTTPLPVLKSWLRWQVLRSYAELLDRETAQRHFSFESGVLRGVPEQEPRWKRGLAVVESAMGDGLGQYYVERHFPPAAKARIELLVAHLIAAYGESIDHLDWLGEESRQAAHDKLAHIRAKLGYPDHWRDYSQLLLPRGDLVGSVQAAQRFESHRQLDRLGHPVDRDEWDMTPQTVNAYYNPTLNEIVFPAAQLQSPYFDPEADDAANYGDIGFIIGHELSHAFDDEGSQFDAAGNLRDWWTPADHAAFRSRTQTLVAQYGAVSPIAGTHVNGELTLGENIADNAGLTIAWKAYLASLQGREPALIDGMSAGQRFFVSYAQSWMGKQREADVVKQLKSDPHAPFEVRTNLAVRNQDGFHAAFGTAPGDPMWLAPEARVRLW